MPINEKVAKLMNEQIMKEWYSAYLYMSMAGYLEVQNLPGMAHWMQIQVLEELSHGRIFQKYLAEDMGIQPVLEQIAAPPKTFASPQDVFEKAYEHELTVTASINNIMDHAIKAGDHASRHMLEWFIAEQVEEEKSVSEIVAVFKRMPKGHEAILFQLDAKLGTRTFTLPPQLAAKGA